MSKTNHGVEYFETYTVLEKQICCDICVENGIDPEKIAVGLGKIMPKNYRYPLWQAQLPIVRNILSRKF